MNNKQELELVKECLKGADSAFKALYNLYHGYVYTICVRYGIATIEIKDCLQTIFMEVFKSLDKYDPSKSKLKTWLTQVTINQILLYKRKLKISYTTLNDEEVSVIESDLATPIESLMDEKIMYAILSRMPAKYSSVFNLFIIDGYSHSEIASILNITEGASRTLLHRGRIWAHKELKVTFKDSIIALNVFK